MTKGTRYVRHAAHAILAAAVLFLSCLMFGADKKSAPAPAPKAAAPAKAASPGGAGAHPGAAAGATHGPTTTSHGPTTGSPHATTSGTHGPTTSSPHGATTTSPRTTTTTPRTSTSTAGRPAGTPGKTGAAASGRTAGTAGTAGRTGTAAAGGHGWSSGKTPNGAHVTTAKNGATVAKRADGKVATVHDSKRNMDVHHNLAGGRTIVKERADHSRVVVERNGRGYVEHGYHYHGRDFRARSYYYHGHVYGRYYGSYGWHGAYFYPYYPAAYYAPGFYGWAYNPWAAPIAYGWGWGGNPWYGYYGAYFTPWPVYPSAAFWLTDYLIAQSLQAAYVAQAAALSNPAPMTPDVKQLVADEVKRQIALENAEAQGAAKGADPDPASSSIQRMLTDGTQHVFVAGADLDVVDSAGSECALSEGDALQLSGQTAPDAQAANLVILASKGGKECPKGDLVSVGFQDLQEMQNHMRELVGQGMQELQQKQGQGGLPAAPASAKAAPTPSAVAQNGPPPDQSAAQDIQQEQQEADQAEKEAGETPAPLAAPAAPPTEISVGMTIDQVTAALGQPKQIINLGATKKYIYADMKITFKDGKVSDVQ